MLKCPRCKSTNCKKTAIRGLMGYLVMVIRCFKCGQLSD